MDKEDFKYCPKCRAEHSILMFNDCSIVECQNLNCGVIFNKEKYLEFLEFWENLDHSLDEQYDKLVEDGKKLGFDSPNRHELFHIDAIDYSWDSELDELEEELDELEKK